MAKLKKTTSSELLFHNLRSKVVEQLNQNEIDRNMLQQRLQVIDEIFNSFNDTGEVIEADIPKKQSKKSVKKKAVKKKASKKNEVKKRPVKKLAENISEIAPSNGNGHAEGANGGKPLSWFHMAGKVMSRQKFMTAKEITDEIQKNFELGERKIGSSIGATLSANLKTGKVVSKASDEGTRYKLK